MLFAKRRISPERPQRNLVFRDLKLELIARYKLEFLANRLGQYDSPGFVEGKSGSHTSTLPFFTGERFLRLDHPGQVEHWRRDAGLRKHRVDLAAMVRLVVEEMREQHGRQFAK